jgi:hypothetical protein
MRYKLEFPRNTSILIVHVDKQLTDKDVETYLGREHL